MSAPDVLEINSRACTACRACEIACHYHHTGTFGTSRRSIVVRFDADTGALGIEFGTTCDSCVTEVGPRCAAACLPGALRVRKLT